MSRPNACHAARSRDARSSQCARASLDRLHQACARPRPTLSASTAPLATIPPRASAQNSVNPVSGAAVDTCHPVVMTHTPPSPTSTMKRLRQLADDEIGDIHDLLETGALLPYARTRVGDYCAEPELWPSRRPAAAAAQANAPTLPTAGALVATLRADPRPSAEDLSIQLESLVGGLSSSVGERSLDDATDAERDGIVEALETALMMPEAPSWKAHVARAVVPGLIGIQQRWADSSDPPSRQEQVRALRVVRSLGDGVVSDHALRPALRSERPTQVTFTSSLIAILARERVLSPSSRDQLLGELLRASRRDNSTETLGAAQALLTSGAPLSLPWTRVEQLIEVMASGVDWIAEQRAASTAVANLVRTLVQQRDTADAEDDDDSPDGSRVVSGRASALATARRLLMRIGAESAAAQATVRYLDRVA